MDLCKGDSNHFEVHNARTSLETSRNFETPPSFLYRAGGVAEQRKNEMKAGFLGPMPEKRPEVVKSALSLREIAKPPVEPEAGVPEQRAPRVSLTADDFTLGRFMGEGSFSHVIKANRTGTNEWYALKIMDKKKIMREKKVDYIKNERNILDRLDHPGVVRLHFTFQDQAQLFMGLEACDNGELLSQIKRKGKLSIEEARQYTCEILVVVKYVHDNNIIHRDIKPENLLVGDDGHLKLCDFGSAKIVADQRQMIEGIDKEGGREGKRKSTFVGTAEYVSPEVLDSKILTRCCDFWAIGCVLFQMLVGKPPYRGETEYLTFQKILNDEKLPYPDDFPEVAKDLIEKLLVKDADKRLGAGPDGHENVRAHAFFEGVDWDRVLEQEPPTVAPGHDNLTPTEDDGLETDFPQYCPGSGAIIEEECPFIHKVKPGEDSGNLGMSSLMDALHP